MGVYILYRYILNICGCLWKPVVSFGCHFSAAIFLGLFSKESLWPYSPGRPETHCAHQAGLQQKSISFVLQSKVCGTTPSSSTFLLETESLIGTT